MLLHLLLPIGFTLSPLLGWLLDLPWLTLFIAMLVLPLAEWLFGRVNERKHRAVHRAVHPITNGNRGCCDR
jgi:hypothetical protein